MREIKFRGKHIDNGEWLYGNLVELRNPFNPNYAPACFIMPKEANIAAPDSIAEQEVVDPDTVGQFTGLLDKNGEEIYEGDVIESDGWSGARHYVGYRKKDAKFVAFIIGTTPQDYCSVFQHWIDDYDKKVIGNIHDNPEILSNDEHDPGTSVN